MSRFLRETLRVTDVPQETYAHREPLPCDLSLISGPFVWQEEVTRALAGVDGPVLRDYANPHQNEELLAVLADLEGLVPDAIWLTPGADQAVEAVLGQFLEAGDSLGIVNPNFPRFRLVAAGIRDLTIHECESLAELPRDLTMAVVCTPNNPSTKEIPHAELAATAGAHPDTLFCVDGVFDWYSDDDLAVLCREHDNVLVLKSFSKIGLAGLRLGYAMGEPDLVADLQRGLTPFAVTEIVQRIGLEVARNFGRLAEIKTLLDERYAGLTTALGDLATRRSPLPFYLLETNCDSTAAAGQLADAGIAVVDGHHFRGLPPRRLRVAIGDADQNRRLLEAVDRLELVG